MIRNSRAYEADSYGRIQYGKPSYAVGKDGRVVQTDAYGNKQYGKTQYQVEDGKVYVQPFADLGRLEFIRMVDYGLPGVLSEDLGVDASKAQAAKPPSAAVQAPMPPKPATTKAKLKPAETPEVEGSNE